jgi:four helix bundle protein
MKCGVRGAECGMENKKSKPAECGMPNAELGKMERNYLKKKTKIFALQTIKLVESLPRGRTADVIGRQLLDAGTSVGANYRAACRARSPADFISKMGIVEEEADETIYWMELLIEAKLVQESDISPLLEEANQILAMTVSSIKTARRKTSK